MKKAITFSISIILILTILLVVFFFSGAERSEIPKQSMIREEIIGGKTYLVETVNPQEKIELYDKQGFLEGIWYEYPVEELRKYDNPTQTKELSEFTNNLIQSLSINKIIFEALIVHDRSSSCCNGDRCTNVYHPEQILVKVSSESAQLGAVGLRKMKYNSLKVCNNQPITI